MQGNRNQKYYHNVLKMLSEEQKYQEIAEKILKGKIQNEYIIYSIIVLEDERYAKTKFFKISVTEKIMDGKIVICVEVAKNLVEDKDFLKIFEKGLLKAIEKK